MKLWSVIVPVALGLGFAAVAVGPAAAQSQSPATTVALDGGRALTEEETRAFDARLRAAGTEQVRAKIAKERDDLVRVRLAQRGTSQAIPPGPGELSGDLVMPDVPTLSFDVPRLSGMLPGGALAPVNSEIYPLGVDAYPDILRR